jgi:GntR family transcriptional regulator
LAQLRKRLAEWVLEARTAGLEDEDIDALVRAVLAGNEPKGAKR